MFSPIGFFWKVISHAFEFYWYRFSLSLLFVFRNLELDLVRQGGILFLFVLIDKNMYHDIYCRLVCKNSGEALQRENLLLNGKHLLFAIIFLNVLLTLELLHFVLKVGWDYQYRKFEDNGVCWHHHHYKVKKFWTDQFLC